MDYADKLSAFTSNFDEAKNTFYSGQGFEAAKGALQEKAGQASETIGLPVAGIAYKAAGKLGLNDMAETTVKQAVTKGGQAISNLVGGGSAPAAGSGSTGSTYMNPAFEGAGDAADDVVADAAGDALAVGAGEAIGGAAIAATLGAAIPIIGGIAALAYGIVKLVKGHHEQANSQKKFTFNPSMDAAPVYEPGQR